MTATAAPRFDRRAIMQAAWAQARWQIAAGVARLVALKLALRDAWAAAKNPAPAATQKSIARVLDRSAERAGSRAATSKQCWFLAGLMLKAGEDGSDYLLNTSLALTGREASSQIDFYLGNR